jgi:Carboxypeptidase regulatory-like domain
MRIFKHLFLTFSAMLLGTMLIAQVTTSSLTGVIKGTDKKGISGATIEAVHEPSGTKYRTISQTGGSFTIPAMRVGGPYTITVSFVGNKPETYTDVFLQLATPAKLDVEMIDANKALQEVVVTASGVKKNARLISPDRKGTGTNISRKTLENLPTLSRSITDFTKLTPQSRGTSFAGLDDRFNNLTIDGSIFNNSFGLQSLPGSQTNSTPISLDAIEEIQINLSPYSVKEAGFTGAGINAITKSGTNTFHGSAFYNQRNEAYVGKDAGNTRIQVANFDVKQFGFRFGGAIIKNKLFFFVNAEAERRNDPGVSFVANNGDATADANETRVKATDLDALSSFLQSKFNYNPGAYQGYDLKTYSNKALARIDWNINDVHKFSFRFNYLRSYRDVPVSNSGAFNGRRDNLFAMTYANSNYVINNDIYSAIAEINSSFSNRMSNNMIFGFTANRDYRSSNSTVFPLVDILEGGRNLITFGYEPFTANNTLNTDTWQWQDNIQLYRKKHTYSMGVNFEAFKFFNSFTPTIYGRYAFKSLADFYTSANAFIANPNITTNPVQLQQYDLTYSAQAGGALWAATTKAYQVGAYIQDEFTPFKNMNITYGVRMDIPFFGNTALTNDSVSNYAFKDEEGKYLPLNTGKLPGAKPLFNPRLGFNWDVTGKKQTQIRGGVGVFSGRPAFVWISNQMGNTGVQSGSLSSQNTTAFAFNPDPRKWIPGTITSPAPSYNIAVTDKNFKFPQIFRTNLAIDQQLPWGMVASVEFLYTKFINNVAYINANLREATSNFIGADTRPRFNGYGLTGTAQNNANRINPKITDATVLKNTDGGYSGNFTVKLEKPFRNNFGWMMAYNRGFSKDLISAGSIAFSSWSQNFSVRGNNHPDLSYSNNDQRNRFIANLTYRVEWLKRLGTTFSLFYESRTQGRYSYVYSGDFNGDQLNGNDLVYIPANKAETFFETFTDNNGTATTSDDITFTPEQQQEAYWNYIQQDEYLSKRLGQYAERNGAILPMVTRMDLSITQDISQNFGKQKHSLQLRMDIFNIGNLLNQKNGVGDVVNNNALLAARGLNAQGYPIFRMNTVNRSLNYATTRKSTNLGDVWQMQLGVRYTF